MKLNAVDQQIFGQKLDQLRDSITHILDTASDEATARLGAGSSEQAIINVMQYLHENLAPALAEACVWAEAAAIVDERLNAPPTPMMEDVIEVLDDNFHKVLQSSPVFIMAKPEFFPHLIVAYCQALSELRETVVGDLHVRNVCAELDVKEGRPNGASYAAVRQGDNKTGQRAVELVARRHIAQMVEEGFTPEGLEQARQAAIELGCDPDALGLPRIHPASLRAAELDGGPDNIPRAVEEESGPSTRPGMTVFPRPVEFPSDAAIREALQQMNVRRAAGRFSRG